MHWMGLPKDLVGEVCWGIFSWKLPLHFFLAEALVYDDAGGETGGTVGLGAEILFRRLWCLFLKLGLVLLKLVLKLFL